MSRTRTSRHRRLAAVAALLGLGLSGVVATPAFANGDLAVTIIDNSTGAPYANSSVVITNAADTFTMIASTDGAGVVEALGLDNDTYFISAEDATYYPSSTPVVVNDNVASDTVNLDRRSVVTGSINLDADGHTYARVEFDFLGSWVDYAAGEINSGDGSFTFPLTGGVGNYRITFEPDDSVNYQVTIYGPFSGGADNSIIDIGSVNLTGAGVISGVVTDTFTGDPLAGATVLALSSTTSYSDVTDADGIYTVKLPLADDSYTLLAQQTGFIQQYWDHVDDGGAATPVVLDAGNTHEQNGVDFDLDPVTPVVSGNMIALDELSDEYDVDVDFILYPQNVDGSFSADTSGISYYGDHFEFDDLVDGVYRLGFADGAWLPWRSLSVNGAPTETSSPGSDCYVEFTVTAGLGDIEIADILLDLEAGENYCEAPPWATASTGVFSGTITNIDEATRPVIAELYSADDDVLLDSSPVNPVTGAYSLTGIGEDGGYFVLFTTGRDDPVLDTLLGDFGGSAFTAWSGYDDAWDVMYTTNSIQLTANTDSTGNDLELLPATVFSGVVTADGLPVPGACVLAENLNTANTFVCDETDDDGVYFLKVPVGGDWFIYVEGAYGYEDQYWNLHDDYSDAEGIWAESAGLDDGYDFELVGWPPYIVGLLGDDTVMSTVDDYIVHIYVPVTGGWTEIATTVTSGSFVNFEFDDSIVGVEGTYRLRFETPTGEWVNLSGKMITTFADLYTAVPTFGSFCYIDVPLEAGPETWVLALFESAGQTGACGAEPAVSTGGGGSVTPPTTSKPRPRVVMPELVTPTATPTPTPTAEPTEQPTAEPSADPSEQPTPTPDEPAADYSWVWIIIAILVLLVALGGFVLLRRRP